MIADQWFFPENLLYDTHYQWIRHEAGKVLFGLTPYGLDITGDVLYLALPQVGAEVRSGESCGSLEAGKWVGRVYAPVSGKIIRVNQVVADNPSQIEQNPYACWFAEIEANGIEEIDQLMDSAAVLEWIAKDSREDE